MSKRFLTFLAFWGFIIVILTLHTAGAYSEQVEGTISASNQLQHFTDNCSLTRENCADQNFDKNTLEEVSYIEYNHRGLDESYAKMFDSLGIALHPGSTFTREDKVTPSSLNHCKALVYKTLTSLPQKQAAYLKHLTLYFHDEGRRGLGGGSTIILRCQNVTDKELVSVLVHEMGHIVDTGLTKGDMKSGTSEFKDGNEIIPEDDPSVFFYRLSFKDEKTLKEDAIPLDFVSGYAMSDPFEDFAESYNFYILHGDEFRKMLKTSDTLHKKYNYLKIRFFHGKEYFNGDQDNSLDVLDRHYDATVLNYDLNKFFARQETRETLL